jgi:hypothetical protein
MTTHELKILSVFFEAVSSGRKLFEVRRNDRDFQEGDLLILREFDPVTHEYTGATVAKRVGFILNSGTHGLNVLSPGYVCMSLLDC